MIFKEREATMFCKYCGEQIADGSSYCEKCGKRLKIETDNDNKEAENESSVKRQNNEFVNYVQNTRKLKIKRSVVVLIVLACILGLGIPAGLIFHKKIVVKSYVDRAHDTILDITHRFGNGADAFEENKTLEKAEELLVLGPVWIEAVLDGYEGLVKLQAYDNYLSNNIGVNEAFALVNSIHSRVVSEYPWINDSEFKNHMVQLKNRWDTIRQIN